MTALRSGFAIVTPASRGLGFAFAQQLLKHTNLPIVASARKDCDGVQSRLLESLKSDDATSAEERLTVYEVDVTNESSISEMSTNIRLKYPNSPLRLAITLPGILHVEKSPSQIDAANALDSFKVNALGPMLLMKHLSQFLPSRSTSPFQNEDNDAQGQGSSSNPPFCLPSHSIYTMMAARVGSTSDNASGGWYSYRVSKASVYQLAKTFDLYLRTRSKERAMAIAMHPGTVKTDFTRDYWNGREMLSADESAERLLNVMCEMGSGDAEGRGRCWDWKGKEVLP
ncbi:short-chain dehydrogenase/reductase [Aspergillus venezuelensis]